MGYKCNCISFDVPVKSSSTHLPILARSPMSLSYSTSFPTSHKLSGSLLNPQGQCCLLILFPKQDPQTDKGGGPTCLNHSYTQPPPSALSLQVETGTPVLTSLSWIPLRAIAVLNFSVYQRESSKELAVSVPFQPEGSLAPKQIYPNMSQRQVLHTKAYWEGTHCQSIKGSVYHLHLRGTIQQIRTPRWLAGLQRS